MVLNQENMYINYIHTMKLVQIHGLKPWFIARCHGIKPLKLFQNNYTFQQFIVSSHESEA
jgi:hypothetical protein